LDVYALTKVLYMTPWDENALETETLRLVCLFVPATLIEC